MSLNHRQWTDVKSFEICKTINQPIYTISSKKWKRMNLQTRMHSSGMRTTRFLTVSQHALRRGGVCALPRGVCAQEVSAQGSVGPGGVSQHALRQTPPVDRQTPVKTWPSQTSFAGGKKIRLELFLETILFQYLVFVRIGWGTVCPRVGECYSILTKSANNANS